MLFTERSNNTLLLTGLERKMHLSDLRTKLLQRLTGENSFVRGLNEKNAEILLNYSIAKLIICIYSVDGGIYSFLGIILLGT